MVLTDEEVSEALRIARKAKHFQQIRSEYGRKVSSDRVYPKHTAEELAAIVKMRFHQRHVREYIVDDHNREVFNLLCYYFAGDPKFEQGTDFNLDKGILLFGGVGVGKTELLRCFCQNHIASFGVFSCREIADRFSESGSEAVESFYRERSAVANDGYGHRKLGVCFDDLGTETVPVQHFGTKKNLMAEIILNRYDNRVPFNLTHITTNLSVAEIESIYGSRCIDRMAQMFNQITFPVDAKSRR